MSHRAAKPTVHVCTIKCTSVLCMRIWCQGVSPVWCAFSCNRAGSARPYLQTPTCCKSERRARAGAKATAATDRFAATNEAIDKPAPPTHLRAPGHPRLAQQSALESRYRTTGSPWTAIVSHWELAMHVASKHWVRLAYPGMTPTTESGGHVRPGEALGTCYCAQCPSSGTPRSAGHA